MHIQPKVLIQSLKFIQAKPPKLTCRDTTKRKSQKLIVGKMVSEKYHQSRAGSSIRNLDASSFKGVSVLITGGGGFFGVHLGRALHMLGAHVTLFDIRPPIEDYSSEIEFLKGDICNKDMVEEACKGKSCVFHIASYGMSGADMLQPTKLIEKINVGGTNNIIQGCCKQNVARLVYTSSTNVVCSDKCLNNATEESCKALPLAMFTDDYSRTKCIAERKILDANGKVMEGGGILRTCALRPPFIYGLGEKRHFPRAVHLIESGQVLCTVGGLESLTDFIHIDNLVNSHILAGDALSEKKNHKSAGEVYFVTDGNPMNNWTFFRPLFEGLGYSVPKFNMPFKFVFFIVLFQEWLHQLLKPIYFFQPQMTRSELSQLCVQHYFNIDKARKHLGFEPLKRDTADIVQYYVQKSNRQKEGKKWTKITNVFVIAALIFIAVTVIF